MLVCRSLTFILQAMETHCRQRDKRKVKERNEPIKTEGKNRGMWTMTSATADGGRTWALSSDNSETILRAT